MKSLLSVITLFRMGNCIHRTVLLKVKNLPPDYSYIVNGQREHKFKYRLTKFKNDDTLTYEDGLTEKQLAELNNLPRIGDAGKTKWVKLLG